ncbi:MAG: XRE family transcriptional regulator [Rhodospirillaceae bacterium]
MTTTLDHWRIRHQLTYAALGALIGASKVQARRYCLGEAIPNPDRMRRIWRVTGGEVEPNSFYDLAAEVGDAAA